MAQLTIELDAEQEKLLEEIAATEHRSAEELCLEALDTFLQSRRTPANGAGKDPYAAFRKMIGLAGEGGPTDSSIYHDFRPGDPR
jgi:hypothetical protein